MAESASRLLDLLSLLQGRRDWPGAELAGRLEVSPRTVRRAVERLRRLGYPVESVSGPAGGYRLGAGAAMPPLLLDDEEAVAIAVGLRTAARASVEGIEEASVRALVKLEQVLPSRLRSRVRALGSATAALPSTGGATVDPETLATIASACRDSERILFAYRDREGSESRRDVEPCAIVNLGRRWYLLAWDRGRQDWRTFRIDRVGRPSPTAVRVPRRDPPHPDPATYVAERLSLAPHRHTARITVRASAEEVRGRVPPGWGTVEPLDGDSCEYRTGDDDLDWLALRVAMVGLDFEVHEPPELVGRLRELAERIARATGT